MADKRYYWLKLKDDFFTENKRIKKLRKIAGGDTYTIIYLKMLLRSLKDNGKLYYEGVEEDFASELALDIDEDEENVKITVQFLLMNGLLEQVSEDEFILNKCSEMTGSEAYSTERSRRCRSNKKEIEALQCNTGATHSNGLQLRDRDRDRDREKREELEIEKETEKDITISNDIVCQTDVRRVVEEWNTLDSFGINPVSRISSDSKRGKALRARIKQYGIDDVLKAIQMIRDSDFLQGKNKQGWTITFDWFVCPNNFPKVLEGNYNNRATVEQTTTGNAYIDAINNRVNIVDSWV